MLIINEYECSHSLRLQLVGWFVCNSDDLGTYERVQSVGAAAERRKPSDCSDIGSLNHHFKSRTLVEETHSDPCCAPAAATLLSLGGSASASPMSV